MAISQFAAAINQLADERGLPREMIVESIEVAVAAAYRREYGESEQELRAQMDEESGKFRVWQVFAVTDEEIENPQAQLNLEDAQKIDKKAKVGETVEVELEPHDDFGRIAAQTAKQVISQRLREAEKNILFEEYKTKEGQLVNGYVQQIEGPNVILNLGKLNGLMIASDQIPNQNYYPGQRLKVLVYNVEETARGPRVLVTRSSGDFISKLFALEVPEIASGAVEIKTIAREAGTRTKLAVVATQPGLDPVGSCVGQRGTRVQSVLSEIGEEKIDIIPWTDESEALIINALSPAKVEKIVLNKRQQTAQVSVPEDQLSLAIGKNGQNVRLASKLTGWEIDIVKKDGSRVAKEEKVAKAKAEKAAEAEVALAEPTESTAAGPISAETAAEAVETQETDQSTEEKAS